MENLFSQSTSIKFIPCVKWVKRGVAKANPDKVELTKEELAQVIAQTKTKLRDTNEDLGGESSTSQNESDEYNFASYDDEGDIDDELGLGAVATMPNEETNEDSDSEKEDDIIKPDDNLVLVAHVEDNASVLEVRVYNENEGSLYVHHDFLLPSIPLCLEWLNYEPGHSDKGNLCAIGSMSPVIEVWDLDIVNCLEAAFTLGQESSRRKKIIGIGHTDAVLDLAWNESYHHILASASVDKTVLLWDLDEGKPHTTLKVFGDKVQCLKWHRSECQTLLAGSCDKTAKVFDCRSDSAHQSWQLDGEAERVLWDPVESNSFLCATSIGSLQCFDCRKGLLWSLEVHEKEVTGLVLSEQCKGFMVTTSSDGSLKVWDHSYNNIPRLVCTRDMQLGTVHCLELCPDSIFTVAVGGDNKSKDFKVLDLRSIDVVNEAFGSRELMQLPGTSDHDNLMETLSINNS